MKEQIDFYQNKLDFEIDSSDLLDSLDKGENIVPLDARKEQRFLKEHIPGAINIPHLQMNEKTTRHLDKSKTYVCYCDGIGCNASTKGALNMAKLGFKAKELIGGIQWWKSDGYATEGIEKNDGQKFNCFC